MLQKHEVDDEAIRWAHRIVVDQIEDAKTGSGDLARPVDREIARWERINELGGVVGGKVSGQLREDEATLFKPSGLAIEDATVAVKVLDRTKRKGSGPRSALCRRTAEDRATSVAWPKAREKASRSKVFRREQVAECRHEC